QIAVFGRNADEPDAVFEPIRFDRQPAPSLGFGECGVAIPDHRRQLAKLESRLRSGKPRKGASYAFHLAIERFPRRAMERSPMPGGQYFRQPCRVLAPLRRAEIKPLLG